MNAVAASRVANTLRKAGIMQPESCPIVLKALEGVQSHDSQERLIGIHMLSTCLEHLENASQLQFNLVVFLLERGVATGIAAAMRAVAAGEWVHNLQEKELFLGSKGKTKVTTNIAFNCGYLLKFLAADRRCVTAILKDFPDLAKVATAIFMSKPSDQRIEKPAEFEKHVKWAMMQVMVPLASMSRPFRKPLAEDTPFMKEVLKNADSLRSDGAQESAYLGSISLIYNVVDSMLEKQAFNPALQVDLLKFLGTILATSMSRGQIKLALKVLAMLVMCGYQQGLSSGGHLVVEYQLDSSLLAMLKVGESLEKSLQVFATDVANVIWKDDFAKLKGLDQLEAFMQARFDKDEQARCRATELGRIFSALASDGAPEFRSLERPKAKTKDIEPNYLRPMFAVRERLECRKCARLGCDSLETDAGTFQICGRCKRVVYCSRGEELLGLPCVLCLVDARARCECSVHSIQDASDEDRAM